MLLQWSKDSRDKGGNLNGTKQKSYLGQNSGVCHSRCDLADGGCFLRMDENATQVGRAIREAHNDEKQMSASQLF